MMRLRCLFVLFVLLPLCARANGKAAYQYFRVGAVEDKVTAPTAGYALMGGGTDLDEAFRWLCARANGGDFLVLRAAGTDAYNPYVAGLEDGKSCKLNSVATLILPSKEAAADSLVAETIQHAEAIFIAGGDQANYIRYWTGTAVQRELNAAIARGVPLGGTSAGLAVMGEWAYSAEGDKLDDPNLDSKTALADPMGPRVTLVRGFLDIPVLKGIITDSHFVKRDRMGRLLVFLARIQATEGHPKIRGLGINEKAAVLVEPDGRGKVIGAGPVYLVQPFANEPPFKGGVAMAGAQFMALRVATGKSINLMDYFSNGDFREIDVKDGEMISGHTISTY